MRGRPRIQLKPWLKACILFQRSGTEKYLNLSSVTYCLVTNISAVFYLPRQHSPWISRRAYHKCQAFPPSRLDFGTMYLSLAHHVATTHATNNRKRALLTGNCGARSLASCLPQAGPDRIPHCKPTSGCLHPLPQQNCSMLSCPG